VSITPPSGRANLGWQTTRRLSAIVTSMVDVRS
jgi:hypothetical protein